MSGVCLPGVGRGRAANADEPAKRPDLPEPVIINQQRGVIFRNSLNVIQVRSYSNILIIIMNV